MITIWIYTLISVFIVSLIALVGIFTLSIQTEKLKKVLFYFISFSAGALLGDVFIHLLPKFLEESEFTLRVSYTILLGIFMMFIIEKFVHWHHCTVGDNPECRRNNVAVMNMIGDFVHNFIDGLVIGASYLVSIPVGIATSIAVVFHEIPQEIGDYGVLIHGGFSRTKALYVNFLTALGAVVGAIFALLLTSFIENITLFLIPFAAGNFIYIAAADLIPELHKEVGIKKSAVQAIFFIVGVFVMAALLFLE